LHQKVRTSATEKKPSALSALDKSPSPLIADVFYGQFPKNLNAEVYFIALT